MLLVAPARGEQIAQAHFSLQVPSLLRMLLVTEYLVLIEVQEKLSICCLDSFFLWMVGTSLFLSFYIYAVKPEGLIC
jgi:hypothetical protein